MERTTPSAESSTTAGGPPTMQPPGFQSASTVLRAQNTGGSLRNASGGQPAIPKPVNAPNGNDTTPSVPSDPASSNGDGQAGGVAEKTVIKPINRPATSKNAIVYNAVQRRNPVLQSIKNVGIEIGDIVADYQVGTHNGVLFLSLKYHRLHPEYIHQRIEKMKNMYNTRILLVLCDINEHQQSLRELSKIAIINQYTTFVAWTNDEVASYLTTFKAYEHKSDDSLKEPIHQSYHDQLGHVLTSGKKVNKTDADNLASQFGSFANITRQPSKVLSNVKGLGATKVTSLVDAFTKPFLVGGLKRDSSGDKVAEPTTTATSIRIDGPSAETLEPVGSPEWPENGDDDDVMLPSPPDEAPSRGRERVPSRSPEGPSTTTGVIEEEGPRAGTVWEDPLDDDEDDDEVAEPTSKRARVQE